MESEESFQNLHFLEGAYSDFHGESVDLSLLYLIYLRSNYLPFIIDIKIRLSVRQIRRIREKDGGIRQFGKKWFAQSCRCARCNTLNVWCFFFVFFLELIVLLCMLVVLHRRWNICPTCCIHCVWVEPFMHLYLWSIKGTVLSLALLLICSEVLTFMVAFSWRDKTITSCLVHISCLSDRNALWDFYHKSLFFFYVCLSARIFLLAILAPPVGGTCLAASLLSLGFNSECFVLLTVGTPGWSTV